MAARVNELAHRIQKDDSQRAIILRRADGSIQFLFKSLERGIDDSCSFHLPDLHCPSPITQLLQQLVLLLDDLPSVWPLLVLRRLAVPRLDRMKKPTPTATTRINSVLSGSDCDARSTTLL